MSDYYRDNQHAQRTGRHAGQTPHNNAAYAQQAGRVARSSAAGRVAQSGQSVQDGHVQAHPAAGTRADASQYRDRSRYAHSTQASSRSARQSSAHLAHTSSNAHAYARDAYAGGASNHGGANGRGGASAYVESQRHSSNGRGGRSGGKGKFVIIGIAACAVIAAGVALFMYLSPVEVTINGKTYNVNGAKTIQAAYETSGLNMTPGNYVDVAGDILESGKGYAYTATVNDEVVEDTSTKLVSGDKIVFSNGADKVEEWTGTEKEIAATFSYTGTGALGVYTGTGAAGIETTMTGKVSGKTVTKTTTEPSNIVFQRYSPYVNGEKVICLTFDDGPSSYTSEILDILEENDAKATFFILGANCEEDWAKEILKREQSAGHQLCTHTYSHAESGRGEGKTGSLGYCTDTQIVTDITKGLDAIKTALGTDTAPSLVMRAPSGYFDGDIAKVLNGYITAEINWDIDTLDWSLPGVSYIVNQCMNAYPGAVLLFHDGGGDRSQTVEALRQALPQLKAAGYKFITIDEMLAYPMTN